MKKILILITILSGGLCAGAQQLSSTNKASMKVMTVEEANRLNGTAQPTINGIPYSQYKAQQQALKNSQQTSAVSPSLTVQPNVVATDGPTPAATTPNVQVGQAPQEAKQPAKQAEKPKGQQ